MARGDKLIDILRSEIGRLEAIAKQLEKNQLVDFGSRVNTNASILTTLTDSLKGRIKTELGEGTHEGLRAIAVVQLRHRETLNSKLLRERVDERIWRPYISFTGYLDCSFKVK